MTQIATVEKILRGGRAEISVPRKSACGHDCESCSGCGMQGSSTHAVALNPIGAQAGQKVVVESSNKRLYGVMLLVSLIFAVLCWRRQQQPGRLVGALLVGGFVVWLAMLFWTAPLFVE